MKENNINVSEMFYSIQGEGITMGVPSVFVRLQSCNLLCKGKDWVCDTIPVWTKGKKTEVRTLVKEVFQQYHKYLVKGAHLVFTGGEPMLQQDAIIEFVNTYYRKYEYVPFLEIETNGTKLIKNELLKEIDLINCSPKTSNSGMKQERTIKADVLRQINEAHGRAQGDCREQLNDLAPMVAEMCKENNYYYGSRLQVDIWDEVTGV